MKQTIVSCLITAACCFAFTAIYSAIIKAPIPDHSERFQKLDAQNEIVKQRETILLDSLMSLGRLYKDLQTDVNKFGLTAVKSAEKLAAYESELKAIKSALKTTNYQDSSKTAILNGLPK